jgi:hypothetical protein
MTHEVCPSGAMLDGWIAGEVVLCHEGAGTGDDDGQDGKKASAEGGLDSTVARVPSLDRRSQRFPLGV